MPTLGRFKADQCLSLPLLLWATLSLRILQFVYYIFDLLSIQLSARVSLVLIKITLNAERELFLA